MNFELGNVGALFETDKDKRKKKLQGGMSPILDKDNIGNQLEQKSLDGKYGEGKIDTSQQSRVATKADGSKAVELEKSDMEDDGFDWKGALSSLSELQGKKKRPQGISVSSQTLSGAGRLGTGLSLKEILKYKP